MSIHHDTLGVTPNASREQIDQAYKRMSKKYHPDRPGGSEEKMKKINAAYEALTKPEANTNLNSDQFNPSDSSNSRSAGVKFGKYDWSGNGNHTYTEWNWADAPDDNLGGYSYNQHMEEMLNESAGEAESERKARQTKEAKDQGWTPKLMEHMNCAWCGDTMEGTDPHEILNKVEPQTEKEKQMWTKGKLVGMHDECHEDARRTVNFDSYCIVCDQSLNNHSNKKCFATTRREMDL
jgi:hypothetical protein